MYHATSKLGFIMALSRARDVSENVRNSVTHPTELSDNGYWYLSADEKSGFGLVETEYGYDLVAVFSTVKGRGDGILNFAHNLGATTLDCFDGPLVTWYSFNGWEEYRREANWVNGEPDIVYMTRR